MAIRDAAAALRAGTTMKTAVSGTIVELARDFEDKSKVRIDYELPPKTKKRTNPSPGESKTFEVRSRAHFLASKDFAQGLAVGDPVTVTTEITRRA